MNMFMPAYVVQYFHVKWFVRDQDWTPQGLSHIITPTFLFWLVFTMSVLLITSILDPKIEKIGFVHKTHLFLDKLKRYQFPILRIGVGIGLLLQLVTGTYLAPTLVPAHWGVYVLLVIAILGLLHQRTLIISGAAITTLYIIAIMTYGLFHMLDYMFYIGIIYYLLAANTKWHAASATMLYFFTGVSLAWLAMEKLTLAKLACSLMHEYGIASLGFTVEDFVLISAFIEMALAWAFIAGIMNRFTALMLTGLFLTTTAIFGITEIIGHAIVHTLLIVFLVGGREDRTTLFRFFKKPIIRHLVFTFSFAVLLFGLMIPYIWMGQPGNGFVITYNPFL
ncbi:hypothetical protein ACFQZE_16770 [Paenibacillus sp. GCM10027627]|uniref:hypothetical protein n=1 Tax=unclassified Paenibacillus TaxID=185978 RepID=UPI00363713AE